MVCFKSAKICLYECRYYRQIQSPIPSVSEVLFYRRVVIQTMLSEDLPLFLGLIASQLTKHTIYFNNAVVISVCEYILRQSNYFSHEESKEWYMQNVCLSSWRPSGPAASIELARSFYDRFRQTWALLIAVNQI